MKFLDYTDNGESRRVLAMTKKDVGAVLKFVSKDPSRSGINHMWFNEREAHATNGHALMVVHELGHAILGPDGVNVGGGRMVHHKDLTRVYRALGSGEMAVFDPTSDVVEIHEKGYFPKAMDCKERIGTSHEPGALGFGFSNTRRVIPKGYDDPQVMPVGLGAHLMANCMKAAADMGFNLLRFDGEREAESDPVYITSSNGDVDLTMLIMPMRL